MPSSGVPCPMLWWISTSAAKESSAPVSSPEFHFSSALTTRFDVLLRHRPPSICRTGGGGQPGRPPVDRERATRKSRTNRRGLCRSSAIALNAPSGLGSRRGRIPELVTPPGDVLQPRDAAVFLGFPAPTVCRTRRCRDDLVTGVGTDPRKRHGTAEMTFPVERQAPSPLRRPDLFGRHRPCRIRTICRRPSHALQAAFVSVRVGTRLQVTSPHRWHNSSACAAMSPRRAGPPARSTPRERSVSVPRSPRRSSAAAPRRLSDDGVRCHFTVSVFTPVPFESRTCWRRRGQTTRPN